MADFKKAYNKTMDHEGGYSNDPRDLGGETYKGISRNNWPQWQGWVLIDNVKNKKGSISAKELTTVLKSHAILQELVLLFYRDNFWDKNKLDLFPQPIANEMFDTGVNMGVTTSARILQESLNLCNANESLYPNISIDGIIGNMTLGSFAKSDHIRVYKTMNLLQGEKYLQILRSNETQERFWGGWLNRVFN